jgi:hypothetical protein
MRDSSEIYIDHLKWRNERTTLGLFWVWVLGVMGLVYMVLSPLTHLWNKYHNPHIVMIAFCLSVVGIFAICYALQCWVNKRKQFNQQWIDDLTNDVKTAKDYEIYVAQYQIRYIGLTTSLPALIPTGYLLLLFFLQYSGNIFSYIMDYKLYIYRAVFVCVVGFAVRTVIRFSPVIALYQRVPELYQVDQDFISRVQKALQLRNFIFCYGSFVILIAIQIVYSSDMHYKVSDSYLSFLLYFMQVFLMIVLIIARYRRSAMLEFVSKRQ